MSWDTYLPGARTRNAVLQGFWYSQQKYAYRYDTAPYRLRAKIARRSALPGLENNGKRALAGPEKGHHPNRSGKEGIPSSDFIPAIILFGSSEAESTERVPTVAVTRITSQAQAGNVC